MKKLFLPLLFLVFFVMLFVYRQQHSKSLEFGVEIPPGFNALGIDVSHHQGDLKWDSLNYFFQDGSLNFVYLKATEGINHIDRQWGVNREFCLSNKIKHGAYHFFIPGKNPVKQADHFLATYNYKHGDLPPALDVEIEHKLAVDDVKIWLRQIEERTGARPIIYTSLSMYKRYFNEGFMEYKFWIASYSRSPDSENDARIIHWQFTEKGTIPGQQGYFDFNVSKLKF